VEIATFKIRYPEFKSASDDLIEACLEDAALSVDATVYGAKYDLAHGLLAAHYLAMNPNGLQLRMQTEQGSVPLVASHYGREFRRIRRSVVITTFTVC
jgi:hypothetical protein